LLAKKALGVKFSGWKKGFRSVYEFQPYTLIKTLFVVLST